MSAIKGKQSMKEASLMRTIDPVARVVVVVAMK
jgi:hypothetical protein